MSGITEEDILKHGETCEFCKGKTPGGLTHDMFWDGVGSRPGDIGLPFLLVTTETIEALKRAGAFSVGDAG